MTTSYVPSLIGTLPLERRDAIKAEARLTYREHLSHMSDNRNKGVDTCPSCRIRNAKGGTGVDVLDLLDAVEAAEAETGRMIAETEQRLARAIGIVERQAHESWCYANPVRGSNIAPGECNCWKDKARKALAPV